MTTTQAIRIHRHGTIAALQYDTVSVAVPGANEVLVRQEAIGLNFADVYQRKGQAGPHDAKPFPITLGANGAGVVEAVGAAVSDIRVGDRVGYIYPGAYAKLIVVPADRIVPLPANLSTAKLSTEIVAGTLLRGLTAEYLLHRLFRVNKDSKILVHAAAGGMGVLLTQWAKSLGALVIGTVGSAAKELVAKQHGCDVVINYSTEDFVARVMQATEGRGVDVVYDAVGKTVFVPSLACLRPMGMAINYGAASGPVGAFDIQLLHHKSLIVTRPTLRTYIATKEMLRNSAETLFQAVAQGKVTLNIERRYEWNQIQNAHDDLESRRTTGTSVLIP
jgi:NADPH:quinone reductase